MRKRMLAILLCLCMAAVLLPTAASAACQFYGDAEIANPFEFADESGTVKIILSQSGHEKTIKNEELTYGDFPLSLTDIEGYDESDGTLTMYVDGAQRGNPIPIRFRKVNEGAIQLGTGGIKANDKVFFGNYTDTKTEPNVDYDVPWIVLSDTALSETRILEETNVLPLLSEYLLGTSDFRRHNKILGYYHCLAGNWKANSSILKETMEDYYNGTNALFTSAEQSALAETLLKGDSMFSQQADLSGQKLFPMSLDEAKSLDSAIRLAKYIEDDETAGWWWLRSSITDDSAYCVDYDGKVGNKFVNLVYSSLGVRPAMNLDTSKVLFISAAVDGKQSVSGMDGALTAVSETTPEEWKLTLDDSENRTGFTVTTTAVAAVAGGSVRVVYSGAKVQAAPTAPEYLSAMLVDNDGKVLYYGRLKTITRDADTSGTQSIMIPAGLTAGSYTLKIFNEQYNDDQKTDYASAMKSVALTVNAPAACALTVDLDGGSGGTIGGDYTEGEAVQISAGTKTNYTFSHWTSSNGGTFLNASRASTTFTMPGNPTAITAHWTYNGGYVPVPETVYATTGGVGGTWTQGAAKGLSFTFNAPYSRFKSLRVDGAAAAPSNYDKREGSTVITLHADYLATLSVGVHTLRAIFSDGYAQTAFTVSAWGNPFTDVLASDWFYEDVACCDLLGLMKGVDGTTFGPRARITRGMVVTILYRMEKEPAVAGECPFADVPSGKYCEDAVAWAAANKIVEGYGNHRFGPNDPVTREQMAVFLYRYVKYKGYDVSVGEETNILSYTDAETVSEFAIPAMQWACGAGIIRGDNGKLMPRGGAQRCQAAAMLVRLLNEAVQ